jgi:hypothetical protein
MAFGRNVEGVICTQQWDAYIEASNAILQQDATSSPCIKE